MKVLDAVIIASLILAPLSTMQGCATATKVLDNVTKPAEPPTLPTPSNPNPAPPPTIIEKTIEKVIEGTPWEKYGAIISLALAGVGLFLKQRRDAAVAVEAAKVLHARVDKTKAEGDQLWETVAKAKLIG